MGHIWEAAVRDHLRAMAARGRLGLDEAVVAIGPWWTADGRVEIDAVALGGRSRRPVLVVEAKWSSSVDGARLVADLLRKAERLTTTPQAMRLGVAARTTITGLPGSAFAITAADVFPDPGARFLTLGT